MISKSQATNSLGQLVFIPVSIYCSDIVKKGFNYLFVIILFLLGFFCFSLPLFLYQVVFICNV